MRNEHYLDYLARLFHSTGLDKVHTDMVKNITFQVTEDCNLRCTYCYQLNKTKNRMTFDVAKKFIDMLLEEPEKCNGYIDSEKSLGVILEFIGGEPFLEIELMDKIVDYFRERTFILQHHWANKTIINISSNGLLYFEPEVQEFIRKNRDILSLSISIDGNKELHDSCRIDARGEGSYDRAIAAVKHYVNELHGNIGSKMTLAPSNISYTFNAVKSLIENGYDDINLNCVFEEGWTNEHASILYYQLKQLADYVIDNNLNDITLSVFDLEIGSKLNDDNNQNWCGGTGNMISVDYKGDIYPCVRYMDSSINGEQEPYCIGNVYDGIGKCDKYCNRCISMEKITRRSQSTDECYNCPIASRCAWCSAYNYQVYGTIDKRATFICCMHKAEVLANIYYWNKKLKKEKAPYKYDINIPEEWALEIIDKDEFEMLKNLVKEMGDVYGINKPK